MKKLSKLLVLIVTVFISLDKTFCYFTTSDTFNSVFKTKGYTFTLNAGGGTFNNSNINVNKGSATLPIPIRIGYEFLGYSTSSSGSVYYSNEITNINDINNIVLYAKWGIKSYTISYDLNGGSISGKKSSYTVEDSFTLPNPTKSGYVFKGWTGSNGSTPQKNLTIPKGTTGNLSYVANWGMETFYVEINPIVQNVEYDYKDGFEFSVWVNDVLDASYVTDWYNFNVEYGTKIKVKVHPTSGYSIYSFTTKTFTITSDYTIKAEWYDDIPPTITRFVLDNYGLYNPSIGVNAGWNVGITVEGYDLGTGIQKYQTWLMPYGNGSGVGREDGSYRFIDNVLYLEEPSGRTFCGYAIDWAGNEAEKCEVLRVY